MAAEDGVPQREQHDLFRDLVVTCAEVGVNVGIINSISERWPDEVQERWCDRLKTLVGNLENEISEAQQFASSWDD